jgi:hypothetical protein
MWVKLRPICSRWTAPRAGQGAGRAAVTHYDTKVAFQIVLVHFRVRSFLLSFLLYPLSGASTQQVMQALDHIIKRLEALEPMQAELRENRSDRDGRMTADVECASRSICCQLLLLSHEEFPAAELTAKQHMLPYDSSQLSCNRNASTPTHAQQAPPHAPWQDRQPGRFEEPRGAGGGQRGLSSQRAAPRRRDGGCDAGAI